LQHAPHVIVQSVKALQSIKTIRSKHTDTIFIKINQHLKSYRKKTKGTDFMEHGIDRLIIASYEGVKHAELHKHSADRL